MSTTTIRRRFKVGGVLANADAAVFSDPGGTYGVRRRDTGAVVVAAGTALTNPSTGLYQYTFTDPASRLQYEFYVKFTDGVEDHYIQGSIAGGLDGNLYDLVPRVASKVGGVPDPVLKQALREGAKDFFQQTGLWREDLDPIASVEGQEQYTLAHGYDADILRVRAVTYNDVGWAFEVGPIEETVTLSPAPGEDDLDIVASVTFLPKVSNDTYPETLLSRWDSAIVAGVLADLYGRAGMPWSNERRAQMAEQDYRYAVADGKRETQTRRGPANQVVRPGRFV